MNKKIIISLLLLLFLFEIIICIPSKPPLSTEKNENSTLTNTSSIGGGIGLYQHFTDSGEFANWDWLYLHADLDTHILTDNTETLYIKAEDSGPGGWNYPNSACISIRDLPNISHYLLRENLLKLRVKFTNQGSNPYTYRLRINLLYTDLARIGGIYAQSGYLNLYDLSKYLSAGTSFDTGEIWNNVTIPYTNPYFTNSPIINAIEINCYLSYGKVEFWLYDEIYNGWLPVIEDWKTHPISADMRYPLNFYGIFINSTFQKINFEYVETHKTYALELGADWTQDYFYIGNYTFFREGYYNYWYSGMNVFGGITYTPMFQCFISTFEYPKLSYLNVRSYEYRDIPEELFYIYLGESETEVLFNFKEKIGNWKPMGNITYGLGYERIGMNTSTRGGIKSDFSHISPGRQYYIDNLTIIFDLYTRADKLIVILNPTKYDYDYLLPISDNYTGIWVEVQIPVFLFQNFPSANQYIGEIGFWGINGSYLIGNIRLGSFYTSNMTINYTPQKFTSSGVSNKFYNLTMAYNLSIINEINFWYNFTNTNSNLSISLWNSYNHNWIPIVNLTETPLNYAYYGGNTTRFLPYNVNISSFNDNLTHIQFYFNSGFEINSFYLKRLEFITYTTYRLESIESRQKYDILIFEREYEYLLIVDFAGRELFREEVQYQEYIDIYIDIGEISLINNENITLWFRFYSRGVAVEYAVPAESTRNVLILFGDYLVRVIDYSYQEWLVREVSVTSTNKTSIKVGDKKPFVYPKDRNLWELFGQAFLLLGLWFINEPIGNITLGLILLGIGFYIYRKIRNRRKSESQKIKEVEKKAYSKGYKDGLVGKNLPKKRLEI